MFLPRPIRLPMATGATPNLLALGVSVIGIFCGVPLFLAQQMPHWMLYPTGVIGGFWGLALLFTPFQMWRGRASDVEISQSGLRIVGGPWHDRRIGWERLAHEPLRMRISTEQPSTWRLEFPDQIAFVTEDPDEGQSLSALAASLTRLADEAIHPRAAPIPTVTRPDVLKCDHCGGPVVPSEQKETSCQYCAESAEVPEVIRQEVRAHGALMAARARSTAALGELLRWCPARAVNALLALAIPPLVLAWPVTGAVFDEFHQTRGVLRLTDGVLLFVFAAALSTCLTLFTQGLIVFRRAVFILFATFRAHPPEREGEAYRCRECGAPLVRPPESPLACCVYCHTDNVIGLDLPRYAATELRQCSALDVLVEERRAARRKWQGLGALCIGLLLTSVASLLLVFPPR